MFYFFVFFNYEHLTICLFGNYFFFNRRTIVQPSRLNVRNSTDFCRDVYQIEMKMILRLDASLVAFMLYAHFVYFVLYFCSYFISHMRIQFYYTQHIVNSHALCFYRLIRHKKLFLPVMWFYSLKILCCSIKICSESFSFIFCLSFEKERIYSILQFILLYLL